MGLSGLISRAKKCEKVFYFLNRKPKRSIVYMDDAGNYLWEEGVEYHDNLLALPLPVSKAEDWERKNIETEK